MDNYLSLADKLTTEAVVEAEIALRTTKILKPRIIYLPEGGLGNDIGLFNEGTIVTIMSQGNPEYINGLEAAIKGKNDTRIRLHCEAIVERTRKDTLRPLKLDGIEGIPIIVDVLYGNAWLAKHVLLAPYTQLALSTSVWSGGKLNDLAFRVLEHRQKKSRMEDVQVLTILIPPKLTKIEKAVLKAVPEDLSEVHVNGPSVSWSAAGLSMKWTPENKISKPELILTDIDQIMVPFYEKVMHENTVQQRQQQQEDTKQQQQQQQQYNNDKQNHQQQQQQQQADGKQQQQQQEQQQDNKTAQNQNQNQQQQQAETKQQQNDQYNNHDAATAQVHGNSLWARDDLDGGFAIRPIDEERYQSLLSRIDFQSMDATQSVKELLRLRERLLTIGLG